MEPVITLIALATAGSRLLAATGVIQTSAQRIAGETREDVRALLHQDFDAGMSAMAVASETTSAEVQEELLKAAQAHFLRAESQRNLPAHFRGLSAGLLAALSHRQLDSGAAAHWVRKSVDHYDAAFRTLDQSARDAMKKTELDAKTSRLKPLFPIGGLVPWAVSRTTSHFAIRAAKEVPSDPWLQELGQQAAAVQELAREIDLDLTASAVGLKLERSESGRIILDSKLELST